VDLDISASSAFTQLPRMELDLYLRTKKQKEIVLCKHINKAMLVAIDVILNSPSGANEGLLLPEAQRPAVASVPLLGLRLFLFRLSSPSKFYV
jgi:hypothetical protein